MKLNFRYILFFMIVVFYISCAENYLDIVPDERSSEEDAFSSPDAAKGYLYSIYNYLPETRSPNSIDLNTTDEIVTGFEQSLFAKFPRGEYTAADPVIQKWDNLYKGIRQGYIFLNKIDDVDELSESKKKKYKGEARFLIGYFHFILLRMYGPIVIVDKEFDVNIDMNPNNFPQRSNLDEVVDFISSVLDEAAKDLPSSQSKTDNFGRATIAIAKSVKAQLLLYAASPLFNGGGKDKESLYKGFLNKNGEELIPTTYDKEKWKRAADAAKVAIEEAESEGHELYIISKW